MKKLIAFLAAFVFTAVGVYSQCSFRPYGPTVVAVGSALSQSSCGFNTLVTTYTPSADGDFVVDFTVEDIAGWGVQNYVYWTDNAGSHTGTINQSGLYAFHALSGDAIKVQSDASCGGTPNYNTYYKVIQN